MHIVKYKRILYHNTHILLCEMGPTERQLLVFE